MENEKSVFQEAAELALQEWVDSLPSLDELPDYNLDKVCDDIINR